MKTLKQYQLPNGRRYRISDTGVPYQRLYPEDNNVAETAKPGELKLTGQTGYKIDTYIPDSFPDTPWVYLSTSETLEEAIFTIGLFARTRNRETIDSYETAVE